MNLLCLCSSIDIPLWITPAYHYLNTYMTHLTTVFHTPSWLLAWLPEMAQKSQNLLLHLLPTRWAPHLVFWPLLSNRTIVFKTQAIIAQVHYSYMVMVSSEPNTLHMKLGLVFTTYIPIHSHVVNLMFFCPVTLPRKILLEFFTFGLIFLLPAKV